MRRLGDLSIPPSFDEKGVATTTSVGSLSGRGRKGDSRVRKGGGLRRRLREERLGRVSDFSCFVHIIE
jgi:hypothetical protein